MTILQMLNTVCSNYERGGGGDLLKSWSFLTFSVDEVDIRNINSCAVSGSWSFTWGIFSDHNLIRRVQQQPFLRALKTQESCMNFL